MARSEEVIEIIRSILGDGPGLASLDVNSELIGVVPELDSMAMVSLITSLEEYFGIEFDDDEMSADTFATVGTLVSLVDQKLSLETGVS